MRTSDIELQLQLSRRQKALFASPKIMALDPGTTTGWCSIDLRDMKVRSGVLDWPEELAGVLWSATKEYKLWVVEDFRVYAHKVGSQVGVRSPSTEVIGFLIGLQYSVTPEIELTLQMAAHAKQMFPDKGKQANKELKDLMRSNYPSNRHARDAARHLMYYLIRTVKSERQSP